MEDFVRVCIADPGENARVGQCALEGTIFTGKGFTEGFRGRGKDVNATGVEVGKRLFAANEMQRCPAFGAGFGKDE